MRVFGIVCAMDGARAASREGFTAVPETAHLTQRPTTPVAKRREAEKDKAHEPQRLSDPIGRRINVAAASRGATP